MKYIIFMGWDIGEIKKRFDKVLVRSLAWAVLTKSLQNDRANGVGKYSFLLQNMDVLTRNQG